MDFMSRLRSSARSSKSNEAKICLLKIGKRHLSGLDIVQQTHLITRTGSIVYVYSKVKTP